jgi:hypothetical protein
LPPPIGAKGSLIGINPKHFGDAPRRGGLIEVEQIGGEAYKIAALFSRGEIAPAAGLDIDLEASRLFIRGSRVRAPARSPPEIK